MELNMLSRDNEYDFVIPYLLTGDKNFCSFINELPINAFGFKNDNILPVHETYITNIFETAKKRCPEELFDNFFGNKSSLEREHLLNNIKNQDSYYEVIVQELEKEVSQLLLKNS